MAEPELEAALAGLATRLDPGATGIERLQRLSGGASQETWAFEVARGTDPPLRLILRRSPPGQRFGERMAGLEVEAALIQRAAKAGVPVPTVRHVLAPEDGIGRGFVMDRIDGETLARRILRDAAFAPARACFAREAGTYLARIHALDTTGIALRVLPPEVEVESLYAQYRDTGQHRPVFDLAVGWLRRNLPPSVPPRLVHGDFRNGNLIFGPEGIRAVLDWEVAHLGDPMRDLAWISVNSWRFGEIDKPVAGISQRQDLFAAYEAEAGMKVDPAVVHFWEVLGSLWWGVMCASMTAWIRSGEDASIERCMIARRASETEIDLMRLLLPLGERHAG
jgi:aminoglycoside phosphotransferase (APT) family kinase protein